MSKYVSTTDSSIGALLLDDGKLVIARKIDNLNVVEIIEDLEKVKELIDKITPVIGQIYRTLVDFFSSIINPFPSVIIQNGVSYRFTEQKAPWKAIDFVFYMSEDGEQIFKHEDSRMPRAKRELRKELKDYGYIK